MSTMEKPTEVTAHLPQLAHESTRSHPECFGFVDAVVSELKDFLASEVEVDDEKQHACRFVHPEDLEQKLAPLALRAETATKDELFDSVKIILDQTVRMGHQRCLNTNFHRADVVAIIADWVATTVNTSIYTYETAPVMTLIEKSILSRYGELLGWGSEVAGSMPPGGSMSNLYGVTLARHQKFPHVAQTGWRDADQPRLFTSADGHYSAKKIAALLGMGIQNVITVPTDRETNTMIVSELERLVAAEKAKGATPFCVIATSGTTLTGAVDDLSAIGDLCDAQGMWMHVDGCMGGALVHSPTLRKTVLAGIEKADSFALNPHKMLGAPLQCCVFVTRHTERMRDTFSTNAAYLFNADKQYDARRYDVGDEVFQCGRRVDCLKLWALWRQRGDEGMAAYIERAVARHDAFNAALQRRSVVGAAASPAPIGGASADSGAGPATTAGSPTDAAGPKRCFLPLLPPHGTSRVPSTCFFWLPPGPPREKSADEIRDSLWALKNEAAVKAELAALGPDADRSVVAKLEAQLSAAAEGRVMFEAIDRVPPRAKVTMMESGFGLVTCSRLGPYPNFWRMITNGAVGWTEEDFARFFTTLDAVCDKTYASLQK